MQISTKFTIAIHLLCAVGGHIHEELDQSLDEIQAKFEEDLSRCVVGDVYANIEKAVR